MSTEDQNPEIKMDANSLFLESVVTDRRVGTIRVLKPIKSDGSPDTERETLYVGQAQMLTPMGAIPLNFALEANSLADAVEKFSDGANEAMEQTAKELQELRREQASSIVFPGAERMPGGIPGGGKIRVK